MFHNQRIVCFFLFSLLFDGNVAHASTTTTTPPNLCVGIQPSGLLVWANFGSMARIAEEYGFIDCASGASSGAITGFLLESMAMHPMMKRGCGGDVDAPCSMQEASARQALFLKTIASPYYVQLQGYVNLAINLVPGFLEELEENGFLGALRNGESGQELKETGRLFLSRFRDAVAAVRTIPGLSAVEIFLDLINEDLIDLIAQSPDPSFHLQDILGGSGDSGTFSQNPTSPLDFVRPDILSYTTVTEWYGRMGNFYAGYGSLNDEQDINDWFNACATGTKGLTWEQIFDLPGSKFRRTCGVEFEMLYFQYQRRYEAAGDPPRRVDDIVGDNLAFFSSVGILTGDAVDIWTRVRDQYLATDTNVTFDDLMFDDMKVGYFGNQEYLEIIQDNLPIVFEDSLLAEKFVALGPTSWEVVLKVSPSEPGRASGFILPQEGVVTVGGWPDVNSMQAIEALNLTRTIALVSRDETPSAYVNAVAEQLQATPDEIDELYSFDQNSSYIQGLEIASGVWCGDYFVNRSKDHNGLFESGYTSPLETSDPFFLEGSYDRVSMNLGLRGCTPGA